jgi:Flp pilus assembly protein TadG
MDSSPSIPLRKLGVDQRGVSAVLVALMTPVLVGAVGLAVDVGLWFGASQQTQRAADAAAMAAAQTYSAGITTPARLEEAAKGAARQNGADPARVSFRLLASGDEMEVTVADTAPSYFAKLFITTPIAVSSRSTAMAGMTMVAPCVIGMDKWPHDAAGVRVDSGSVPHSQTYIEAEDCAVHTNSSHVTGPGAGWGALAVFSGSIDADMVTVVGTAHVGSSAYASISPSPRNKAPIVSIAYSLTADASAMPTRPTSYGAGNHTLQPGRYPGGLTLGNGVNAEFAPGLYIIEGDFNVSGTAQLRNSSGVTFVVRNGTFNWDTNSNVRLEAPTTGALAGVLFWQHYTSGPCPWMKWNSFTRLNKVRNSGVMYFQSCPMRLADAEFETVPGTFTQVLAPWIHINGGGKLDIEWTNPIGVAASLRGGGTAPRLRPNET